MFQLLQLLFPNSKIHFNEYLKIFSVLVTEMYTDFISP